MWSMRKYTDALNCCANFVHGNKIPSTNAVQELQSYFAFSSVFILILFGFNLIWLVSFAFWHCKVFSPPLFLFIFSYVHVCCLSFKVFYIFHINPKYNSCSLSTGQITNCLCTVGLWRTIHNLQNLSGSLRERSALSLDFFFLGPHLLFKTS